MRQYMAAKEAHRDALLLFRIGDFYELFFEDALVAARALELTLTSRNKGASDEIPMAGVPHHAVGSYIQRLTDQGFKVAICEQMADPTTVKGIVPRQVVRVVTPGFVFDEAGLDAKENHFVVALEGDGPFGLAALDLSTGELLACEAPDQPMAVAELLRLDPHEVLFSPESVVLEAPLRALRSRAILRNEPESLDDAKAREVLDALLGQGEAVRSSPSSLARRAASRCLVLAKACEAGRDLPVERLVHYELGETLLLDEATQLHLELVRTMSSEGKRNEGALLTHLDETCTASGGRLLRKRLLAPRTSVTEIRRRLDAVELFVTQPGVRVEFRQHLGCISDLERLAVKFVLGRGGPRDLAALRNSLAALPALASTLDRCPGLSNRESLGAPADGPWLDLCLELTDRLVRAVADEPPVRADDGGVIREHYDAELDQARALGRDGQAFIVALEGRLRESAQIPSLKLRMTRVFGWYIEVTRTHADKVPKTWRRKQTIATGERFTSDELDALADQLAHAEERVAAREATLVAELGAFVVLHAERLRAVGARLAEWDVASALAEVAHKSDYARPEVEDSLVLAIEDGRHPVVEKVAASGKFVPNDVTLDASQGATEPRLVLVTGPNMAGKSTLMRQVALIVILAQMGSFVPARRARIGVVDRVLTRVGASDNLARGESTFMVEMKETANVLRRATRRSLVVLDEIGRGTSTYDGLAIAWAVAEYLHDSVGCRALFATHYHEMTELTESRAGCENFSVSAREHEGDIIFLHKLQRGAASRSYGVACAKLAGLPELVLARARSILGDLERGGVLPTGGKARSKGRKASPQLDLFNVPQEVAPAVALLRAVDVDRLTPLEALQLVARLKQLV
jgi:DNA mismatch repair protein MutS